MATLVLSAVGTAIGGPLGGSLGALLGRQIDAKIIGSPTREGARLEELSVSTSSYGAPIPRVHGTMRLAGTIIWATDLQESRETSGSKGQPKTTSYSYSMSLAVALSSGAIEGVGRIWADGNLLRGLDGALKTAGIMRVHHGQADQPVDPIIASAEGGACPAFRHCAYIVFEDLDLTEFGNRIPALSFEVFGSSGDVELAAVLDGGQRHTQASPPLEGLQGFAVGNGPLTSSLSAIDAVYPLACEASEARLVFQDPDRTVQPLELPDSIAAWADEDFGGPEGIRRERMPADAASPKALRYYDPERDYQPGIQRSVGPTPSSGHGVIEFPGVLDAGQAKSLTEIASLRVRWNRDRLAWRLAELDPAIRPGTIVSVPGQAGDWLVTGWEWRERGVELELVRRQPGPARSEGGEAGAAALASDFPLGATILDYFELPWSGLGASSDRQVYVAASSEGRARQISLQSVQDGALTPLPGLARAAAVSGVLTQSLAPSPSLRFEPFAQMEVDLASAEHELKNASAEALLQGANRLLVGKEIVQFACATPLGEAAWRLTGLVRGRGATEFAALEGHASGTRVVLLDDAIVDISAAVPPSGPPQSVAAIGLADAEPVIAPLRNAGASLRPPSPVHPVAHSNADGGRTYCWTRRARGGWLWPDAVEVPLVEDTETYIVGIGPLDAPLQAWQVSLPRLDISGSDFNALQPQSAGREVWVRQLGSFAQSPALLLETLP